MKKLIFLVVVGFTVLSMNAVKAQIPGIIVPPQHTVNLHMQIWNNDASAYNYIVTGYTTPYISEGGTNPMFEDFIYQNRIGSRIMILATGKFMANMITLPTFSMTGEGSYFYVKLELIQNGRSALVKIPSGNQLIIFNIQNGRITPSIGTPLG